MPCVRSDVPGGPVPSLYLERMLCCRRARECSGRVIDEQRLSSNLPAVDAYPRQPGSEVTAIQMRSRPGLCDAVSRRTGILHCGITRWLDRAVLQLLRDQSGGQNGPAERKQSWAWSFGELMTGYALNLAPASAREWTASLERIR